jgi:hypothetical protein
MLKMNKGNALLYVILELYAYADEELLDLPFSTTGFNDYASNKLHGQILHISKEEIAVCDTDQNNRDSQ